MHLKRLELNGFKSFANRSEFVFDVPIIAIVGPNGSGKSNVVEAIRFVLGEQSVKSMRGKTGSDLVFKGSREIPQKKRASVEIVFDNTDRVFHLHQDNNQRVDVDFDEISISRTVVTDGSNTYRINGNEVRMKDIHELIASINIGSSGHHIISQGEADRYLNANVKDRRVLIEEALGLKVYQYRIKESERKLERAEENMRESELLRRELAPHLRFLKKQVEKIEKAKHLRIDLAERYKKYFSQEDYLIKKIETRLDNDRSVIGEEYTKIAHTLKEHGDQEKPKRFQEEDHIQSLQKEQSLIQQKISTSRQEIGRIEGMVGVLEKQQKQQAQSQEQNSSTPKALPFKKVEQALSRALDAIKLLSFDNKEIFEQKKEELKNILYSLLSSDTVSELPKTIDNHKEIEQLQKNLSQALSELENYQQEHKNNQTKISEYESVLQTKKQQEQEQQRSYYEALARKRELDSKRELLTSRDESLALRLQARNEEYTEAKVLLGVSALEYQGTLVDTEIDITKESQERERRDIERIKIRIEDIGGGAGGDVINEYQETIERDQFLAKEIEDITHSITSLKEIIAGLKETLNSQFDKGIQKINDEFHNFFRLMFGGGKASLETAKVVKRRRKNSDGELVEDENEDDEYGIDIKVQLPRKKVSDLDMLSGGERSLTSIALLFALSQVNPPPFLVLDETDAALDEANSQKYGDMIESLSKSSQLILVTHNRETMSRAQTLFGVTLGRGDASATLSLRLEDAEKYAK